VCFIRPDVFRAGPEVQPSAALWLSLTLSASRACLRAECVACRSGISGPAADAIDLVKLETWCWTVGVDRRALGRIGGRRLYRLRSSHLGAAAYIISRAAARRLLDRSDVSPVDILLFDEGSPMFESLDILQVIPAPAIQAALVRSTHWGQSDLKRERREAGREGQIDRMATERPQFFSRVRRRLRQEIRRAAAFALTGKRLVQIRHG
jgi:GR25 family glycosyltransferase involved in LPS biosynthesis